VVAELQQKAPAIFRAALPRWAKRATPTTNALNKAADWVGAGLLHAGEAEALAHAQTIGSEMFLTDDTAARSMAESIGIPARGSLGVILYGAAMGYLNREEAEQHLSSLATRSTLWLSPRVRRKAEAALAEVFS
jgi:predicted nucleic acid-binding protein